MSSRLGGSNSNCNSSSAVVQGMGPCQLQGGRCFCTAAVCSDGSLQRNGCCNAAIAQRFDIAGPVMS